MTPLVGTDLKTPFQCERVDGTSDYLYASFFARMSVMRQPFPAWSLALFMTKIQLSLLLGSNVS